MENRGKPQNIILILFALLFVGILPALGSSYYLSLVTSFFLYVILTVSWSAFSAPTGYMSLASAAFFGVGVYTMAILGEKLPFIVVILIGAMLSAILAFLVGLSCLRLKGVYFSIFTFGQ